MILVTVQWPDVAGWTAIGTIALALVGAAALIANWRLIRSSDAMVREVQRDRELAVRPILVMTHPRLNYAETSRKVEIRIANIGKGPALMCQYWGSRRIAGPDPEQDRGEAHYKTELFAVGADKVAEEKATDFALAGRHDTLTLYDVKRVKLLPAGDRYSVEAVICRDQFGRYYRFVRGEAVPDIAEPDQRHPVTGKQLVWTVTPQTRARIREP